MNTITGILLGFALLLAGCQSKTDQHNHTDAGHAMETTAVGPVAELEKEVLATHDSVMPQMSELMRLKKAVSLKIDASTDLSIKERGQKISTRLNEADRIMMDWMHEYNGDTLKVLKETQALDYLKKQQRKVNQVRNQMQTAIKEATTFVE